MPAETGDSVVLEKVKKTILVLSGKGGVGKSTVAAQLALAYQLAGLKVGILDIDLCGPSIPRMLGVAGREIHQSSQGWLPVYTDQDQTLGVISIAFLLNDQDDAVIWRGPKKNAMIKQFLTDVAWGERDVLIIDTPPGTSDEHITVMEALRGVEVEGAVLVTTPQAVAVGDVRRELTFCRRTGLKVLGIIENMSGYICPHCSECSNVFSSGGGKALAEHAKVPFLGTIPLEPKLALAAESGQNFVAQFAESQAAKNLLSIFNHLNTNSDSEVEEPMEQV